MQFPSKDNKNVAFALFPGFALTSFALAVETLSVANQIHDNSSYRYHLYSAGTDTCVGKVTTSNGVPVSTFKHVLDCDAPDIMFLCAYEQAAQYDHPHVFSKLRRFHAKGCRFVSLTSGSFILARAGLLENRKCTLFHKQIGVFREIYPGIEVKETIFTVDGPFFTCAGGVTTLDMLLEMIARDHSRDFSQSVSEVFLQQSIRTEQEIQRSNRYEALRKKSPLLSAAVEIMDNNLEHPVKIGQIVKQVGTNSRTLEKLFNRCTGRSPSHYYQALRLEQARRLIEQSNMSLSAIAQSTGFTSQSYFGKRFRETFGLSPGRFRTPKK